MNVKHISAEITAPAPEMAEYNIIERTTAIVKEALGDQGSEPLRAQLYAAFVHRREFPWLGEAGNQPGMRSKHDGLAFGISYALATYQPDRGRNPRDENPTVSDYDADAWRKDVLAAIPRIDRYDSHLQLFASVARRNELKPEDLPLHVARAIGDYCLRARNGTDSDPW